jgi:hypothetical protein
LHASDDMLELIQQYQELFRATNTVNHHEIISRVIQLQSTGRICMEHVQKKENML